MISQSDDPAIGYAGPRTRRVAVIIPLVVAAATLGVIGWSAWPVLRPARQVMVVQAVFDRSLNAQPAQSQATAARNVPTVQAPGWLEAEPFYVAGTALADGVVESIEVLEGDYVEKGQVVARLIAADSKLRLRRAEAEHTRANAGLTAARAEHQAAQRAWDEPVQLERAVESEMATLAEGEAELAQLPLLVESARATLIEMEEMAERVRRSTDQGASNELELIVAEQRALAQRADVKATEARRPILTARVERFRAQLRASQRDLELRIEDRRRLDTTAAAQANAQADVESAHAVRDEAALELERMVIRAPISGYVQRRLKVPGDKVIRMMDAPHSAHLVHLYDPERIQVRVDVPLADASHISVGQKCEVVVEVLTDRVFRGEVLRITNEADLQKNTLQIKVRVIDPDPILRPEMLTRVKFLPPHGGTDSASGETDRSRPHVLVPPEAIDHASGSPRVWLVTDRQSKRGVLTSTPVSVVKHSEEWLTVLGNIQPGSLLAFGIKQPREGELVVIRGSDEQRSWP